MYSAAHTVEEYLSMLPEDRKKALTAVRDVVLKNLPDGYKETMNWGMICYEVPLTTYPDTYNKKPLMYVALASQKNYMAIYMTGLYITPDITQAFKNDYLATGKKLDMGASCIRFKRLEDLPLAVIGAYIAKIPVDKLVEAAKLARSK
jgi:hypothetical protein